MSSTRKTPTQQERIAALRLGDTVLVQLPGSAPLRNTETGALFEPGMPTPQTVTVTLLRRLADQDLVLADAP